MTKIKICGLFQTIDIDYVNIAMPDFIGFIINFPKSHRSITKQQAKVLKEHLNPKIKAVGVFVNSPIEFIKDLCDEKIIDIVQLHGNEDENYIDGLRKIIPETEIWKAFKADLPNILEKAQKSSADMVLFDSGCGTGKCFDWSLIDFIKRPIILAGGLTPENIQTAINSLHPCVVDISSGVETDKVKDLNKILKVIEIVKAI